MVHQREDAKIICELTNSSAISKEKLRWFHNGLEIDFGHRYSKDTRTGHITIVNVRFEDGGLWHCQDRDSGAMGNPVHVIVLGNCENLLFFLVLFAVYCCERLTNVERILSPN